MDSGIFINRKICCCTDFHEEFPDSRLSLMLLSFVATNKQLQGDHLFVLTVSVGEFWGLLELNPLLHKDFNLFCPRSLFHLSER